MHLKKTKLANVAEHRVKDHVLPNEASEKLRIYHE